jgi:hypothetical protein
MEGLVTGWAAEWIKQGPLAILTAVLATAYWLKDRELRACREQARIDAIKVAIALEQAAKEIGSSTEVERQRVEADKVTAEILRAVIKQSDISDERAKDRATGIEAILTRLLGGNRRGNG